MTITKMIQKPYIDTTVVKRGITAYVLENGKTVGFNGYVSAISPTSVTLRGIYGTTGNETNLLISAEQLDVDDYQVFKYAEDMQEIKNEINDSWIEHINITVIDDNIVKPTYFIMYRNNPTLNYTNGLIQIVSEDRISVVTVTSTGIVRNVILTVSDILSTGFDCIVSPIITGGGTSGGTIIFL